MWIINLSKAEYQCIQATTLFTHLMKHVWVLSVKLVYMKKIVNFKSYRMRYNGLPKHLNENMMSKPSFIQDSTLAFLCWLRKVSKLFLFSGNRNISLPVFKAWLETIDVLSSINVKSALLLVQRSLFCRVENPVAFQYKFDLPRFFGLSTFVDIPLDENSISKFKVLNMRIYILFPIFSTLAS